MDDELKKELGFDANAKLPADYNIPFYVHEEDLNKLDCSHKRVEKFLFILCIALLVALIGSNIGWIHYESQFEDVVTETYSAVTDGGGTAIANGDGSVNINGESDLHKDNETSEKTP